MQKKIKFTICMCLAFFCNCHNVANNPEKEGISKTLKDSILESLNSSEQIVYDSPSFIQYEIPVGIDYNCHILGMQEEEKHKRGEVEVNQNGNNIDIAYIYYSTGCVEYLPIINFSESKMKIKLLRIVDVSIFKTSKNYNISYLSKTCENNMEIRLIIDKNKYSNIKEINFNDIQLITLD